MTIDIRKLADGPLLTPAQRRELIFRRGRTNPKTGARFG